MIRIALRSAGIATLSAWLVTLGANVVVGQGDAVDARYAAMGALPPTPPPLSALQIPARDPFADDVKPPVPVLSGADAPLRAAADGPPVPAAGDADGIGAQRVPDIAAFARQANVAVIGVIVGRSDSYALVEDGTAVVVVHPGDLVGGVRVTAIGPGGVDLANGAHFGVDDTRRHDAPPSAAPVAAQPALTPVATPDVASGTRRFVRPSAPAASSAAAVSGSIIAPPIGTPSLIRPDGSAVTPVPAASAVPSLAPLFATPPATFVQGRTP